MSDEGIACSHVVRAGFTLSGAPVQKKCGDPSPRNNWRPFFIHHRPRLTCQFSFSWKTGDIFLLITVVVHWGLTYFGISGMQKIADPCLGRGPLFGRTCWTCLNPPLYVAIIGDFVPDQQFLCCSFFFLILFLYWKYYFYY